METLVLVIGIVELLGFTPGFIAGSSLASAIAPGSKFRGLIIALVVVGLCLLWLLKFPAPHHWLVFAVGAAVGFFGRQG